MVEQRELDLLLVDMPEGRPGKAQEWARLAEEVGVPTLVLAPAVGGRPDRPPAQGRVTVLQKPVAWEKVLRVLAGILGGAAEAREAGKATQPAAATESRRELSRRERQVLESLVEGRSNRSIAQGIGISEPTVKKHIQRILTKLDARDRVHAAVIAVRAGLVEEAA